MTRMLTALVAVFAISNACAQVSMELDAAAAATPTSTADNPVISATPELACCRVPANTLIDLEILDLLNSHQHKRGDKFRLRVVTPIVIDGTLLIAGGTLGIGEIVHAAAARGGGAPGELLIAARSLDISGQSIPLRGLKFGATGDDNSGMAFGVSLAAGPFAMFIRGREIEIPVGTRVNARLAQEVTLSPTRTPSPPTAISTEE